MSNENESRVNKDFYYLLGNSKMASKARASIERLAMDGPRKPNNSDYVLDPIAREFFQQKFGFKPEAGQQKTTRVKNKLNNIIKSPQEKLKIMFTHANMNYKQYYKDKVDELTKKDEQHKINGADNITNKEYIKTNEQWFELAEDMETNEVEEITDKMGEKVKELNQAIEISYRGMENQTALAINILIDKGCTIRTVIIDSGISHQENREVQLVDNGGNIKKLSIENIDLEKWYQAKNIALPSILIMARTSKDVEIDIKIKDQNGLLTGHSSCDLVIETGDDIQDIESKISSTIQSKAVKSKEKTNKNPDLGR